MKLDGNNLLTRLRRRRGYAGQIVHVERLEAQPPEYADLEPPLPADLVAAIARLGIDRLYAHQVAAIEKARAGRNVVVVSGTASGKTLCYNAPVLERLMGDRVARALYIFPTKALAQDQLRKLREFDMEPTRLAGVYDGDTPTGERRAIRRVARLVLSNPDMLHVGILPNHALWADFLRDLRYVVVDEVHMYTGVFGAHAAHVLRRLRRLCRRYGSDPQFLCATATIGNPLEAVRRLTGLEHDLVTAAGAPRGRRWFVFWNPPLRMEQTEVRRSAAREVEDLFEWLLRQQVRTIVFTTARVTAEVILQRLRRRLGKRAKADDPRRRVMAYRAGYLPSERREIERKLFEGELLGVVSTSALEVGVDIGGLDCSVLCGYPGSIASTWQQAGRAGRGQDDAVMFLVATNKAVDQHLMRTPDYFFSRPAEQAVIDPENRYILGAQLLCAAQELPLADDDLDLWGDSAPEILTQLEAAGLLSHRGRWRWRLEQRPHDMVNIRSAAGEAYTIRRVDGEREIIGAVDAVRAFDTVHAGAIYLHQGETFEVESLDLHERVARVRAVRAEHYTVPLSDTTIGIVARRDRRNLDGDVAVQVGELSVETQVTGFRRLKLTSAEVIDTESLDLPAREFDTQGLWIEAPAELAACLSEQGCDLLGSLHALEHLLVALMPLCVTCDERDLSGVSYVSHPDTEKPTVFIYDGYPGGAGISEEAFEQIKVLLTQVVESLRACPCEHGCPSCVQSPRCGSNNQPLDKSGAAWLARVALGDAAPPAARSAA